MDADVRSCAKDLAAEILRRPEADRAGFLQEACTGNERLRAAVESLLSAEATATGPARPDEARTPTVAAATRRRPPHPEGMPQPGELFAERYRIEKELGHGAFGVVYRAFDEGPLQRKVALKVIRFDKFGSPAQVAGAKDRFLDEARLAGRLSHGNLATIHEVSEHHQWVYMTQELARGRDLARILAAEKRVPLRQTIAIVRQICEGLGYAHAQGIVHRDIKPSNIVVHDKDGEPRVKITDFGLAQPPVSEDSTLEGLVAGTPGYMAPEQLLGRRVDHRADIFAVGCVLYEMLVGRQAFRGDTFSSAADQTLHRTPPPPSRVQDDLPRALDRIIDRVIAKAPDDRYQSLNDLTEDLLHYEQYEYLIDRHVGAADIAESIRTGNCALFLGMELPTGPSERGTQTSDRFICSWLAKDMEQSASSLSLPQIAQNLEMERGRGELLRRLSAAVENANVSPREVLRRVSRLPLSVIVTTRYDSFLEEELARQGRKVRRVVDCRKVPDRCPADEELMIRLFGSLDEQETLVITEDDLWQFFNDFHLIADSLKSIFATRQLLFVGYDHEDTAFRQLFQAILQFRTSGTAGCYLPTRDVSVSTVRWAERKGLRLIDAEPGPFLSLLEETIVEQRREVRVEREQRPPSLPSRPYKFLNYYGEDDELIFFGRRAEAERMISKINAYPLNLLYAPSGTGKTSLINAALIPQLRREGYLPVYVRVYDDPLGEVRRRVIEAVGGESPQQPATAADEPFADLLGDLARRAGRSIVVFVDQFEEIFIRHGAAVRTVFAEALQTCIDKTGGRVRFVLSLREDFLARLAEFRERIPTIFHNEYRLGPLTEEAAREAIVEPAKLLGIEVEDNLVERLLADLTAEGIEPPQLQIVMDQLYDALPAGGKHIKLSSYQALGETRKILAGYLERVVQQLPDARRRLGREILKTLVTSEQTKVVSPIGELVRHVGCSDEEAAEILKEFSDHRLLRRIQTEEGYWYELMHEYLVEEISQWLSAEEKELKRVRELLGQAVRIYRNLNVLIPGGHIQLIRTREAELHLGREERELLRLSERAVRSQRKRIMAVGAAAAVLLATAGVAGRYFYLASHIFIEPTVERDLESLVRARKSVSHVKTLQVFAGSPSRWWIDRPLGFPKLVRETDIDLGDLEERWHDVIKRGKLFPRNADPEREILELLEPEEQVRLLVVGGDPEQAAELLPEVYENPDIDPHLLDQMTTFLAHSGLGDEPFLEKAIAHGFRPLTYTPTALSDQHMHLVPLLAGLPRQQRRQALAPFLQSRGGLESSALLLGLLGDQDKAELIRTSLDAPSEEVRASAFFALTDLGDCGSLTEAWETLDRPGRTASSLLRSVVAYIVDCGSATDVARLEEIATHRGITVYKLRYIIKAMYALGDRSAVDAIRRVVELQPELEPVRGFTEHGGPEQLRYGIYQPEADSLLRRFLGSSSPEVRDTAAEELARRGDPSGVLDALRYVRDGVYGGNEFLGFSTLTLLRGPEILQVLLERVGRLWDIDAHSLQHLLEVLRWYDDEEVLDALIAGFTHEEFYVRRAAAGALAFRGSDAARARLMELVTSDDPLLALYANATLADIDGGDRSSFFRDFLRSPPADLNDLDAFDVAGSGLRDAYLRLPVSAAIEALGSRSRFVRHVAIRGLVGHEDRRSALEPLERLAEGTRSQRAAARQTTWAIEIAERNLEAVRAARRAYEHGNIKEARRMLDLSEHGTAKSAISFGLYSPIGVSVILPRADREAAVLRAEMWLAEGTLRPAAKKIMQLTSDDRELRAELAADPRFAALQRFYDYRVEMGLQEPLLVEGLDLSELEEPPEAPAQPSLASPSIPPAETSAEQDEPGASAGDQP